MASVLAANSNISPYIKEFMLTLLSNNKKKVKGIKPSYAKVLLFIV